MAAWVWAMYSAWMCKGKGTLTVENGQMTIHISLPSKSILNLFCGTAEDARKDGAALLQPTTDTVTYSDGLSEDCMPRSRGTCCCRC